jgi:ribosome biogenesis protein Nip4
VFVSPATTIIDNNYCSYIVSEYGWNLFANVREPVHMNTYCLCENILEKINRKKKQQIENLCRVKKHNNYLESFIKGRKFT